MMRGDGKPFEQGQSGNPSGRPKGARNRATQILENILDGDAEAILRKVVEMAQDGDPTAMRLCLDRMMPPRRDRLVTFELPEIATTNDLPKATAALLRAVAEGELTPGEAADIGKSIDAHVKALEVSDIAERLRRIEEGERA